MSRSKQEKDTWLKNNATYRMYLNRIIDMYLSLFEWKGLPKSINVRYLEMTLMEQGKVIFFHDEKMGYLALNGAVMGFNVYNEPINYNVYAPIGYQKQLTDKDSVIIWNTFRREPYIEFFQQYAERLTEITRTQDVNVKGQKTPVLIRGTEQQMLALNNLYQKYDGNAPVIFGDNKGMPNSQPIEALNTQAPYIAQELQLLKNDIWNECMTFLGIGNANQDKVERLVSDEVSANDQQIMQGRHVMLDARKEACEQINEMFNLNISVDYKLNTDEMQLQLMEEDNYENITED